MLHQRPFLPRRQHSLQALEIAVSFFLCHCSLRSELHEGIAEGTDCRRSLERIPSLPYSFPGPRMQEGESAGSRHNSLGLRWQPPKGMDQSEEKVVQSAEKLPAHEHGE